MTTGPAPAAGVPTQAEPAPDGEPRSGAVPTPEAVPQRGTLTRAALALIRFYSTAISPALPPRCRFTPTCSAFAAEAISRFGLGRGMWLAVRRLLRCHPFHKGGHDPVPPAVRPAVGAAGGAHPSTSRPSRPVSRPAA